MESAAFNYDPPLHFYIDNDAKYPDPSNEIKDSGQKLDQQNLENQTEISFKRNEMPNFSNPFTKATEGKMSKYEYDQPSSPNNKNLIERGLLENYLANGKGRLIHSNLDVYEGDWLNQKAHGNGTYIHLDGAKYTGDWRENIQHGFGVETWPVGARYEGNYEYGKKHGKGTFLCANGRGVQTWIDGRKYDGQWSNNKMQGLGIYSQPDGRKYMGWYVDDKQQGYGEFSWPDGSQFKGDWFNGEKHGKINGVFVTNEWEEKYGEWVNGTRIRWINPQEEQQSVFEISISDFD